MRLLIAGGGTGGHLFPALAVARVFRAEEPDGALLMVGRAGGPEERLVPEAGFELATVRIQGLDRDALWKNAALPAVIPGALRAGIRIVDRFKPDVVLGMGGYVMTPAIAAARLRSIPYVLHEKDVRPGLATRMFAGAAAAVCTTLPGTDKRIKARRVVQTGVPLRLGFVLRRPAVPPRSLLVTGGSQGARNLNLAVWGALDELCARFEEVVHVAGRQGAAGLAEHRHDRYRGLTFTDDMAALMSRADLVVSRAGASPGLACLARGAEVTGCDAQASDTTAELEDAGVAIEVGHDPEHVLGHDLLVYTGAVRADAPEVLAAWSMGVEVKTRAEA